MDAKSRAKFINSVAGGQIIPCPVCGAANPPGSNFCITCGSGLSPVPSVPEEEAVPDYQAAEQDVVCSVCGEHNPPGSRFCISCGSEIAASVNNTGFEEHEIPEEYGDNEDRTADGGYAEPEAEAAFAASEEDTAFEGYEASEEGAAFGGYDVSEEGAAFEGYEASEEGAAFGGYEASKEGEAFGEYEVPEEYAASKEGAAFAEYDACAKDAEPKEYAPAAKASPAFRAAEDEMVCPVCGERNKPDSRFCVLCGNKFSENPAVSVKKDDPVFQTARNDAPRPEEKTVRYEEPKSVFADGLPQWDIIPPQVTVRRH